MYNIKLSEIMTTELTTLASNDLVTKVDEIFKENVFHHIPVVNNEGKILGIVSKSDYQVLCDSMTFFQKGLEVEKNKRFFSSLTVREIMRSPVATLSPDDTVQIAAGIFKENLFHAIPISASDNILVGLVTTFDMINYAYSLPLMTIEAK